MTSCSSSSRSSGSSSSVGVEVGGSVSIGNITSIYFFNVILVMVQLMSMFKGAMSFKASSSYALSTGSQLRQHHLHISMCHERKFYHDKPIDLPSLPDSASFDPMEFVVDPAICYFDDVLR